jgi:hypothetical protein
VTFSITFYSSELKAGKNPQKCIYTKRLSEEFFGSTDGFYVAVLLLKIVVILVGVLYFSKNLKDQGTNFVLDFFQ